MLFKCAPNHNIFFLETTVICVEKTATNAINTSPTPAQSQQYATEEMIPSSNESSKLSNFLLCCLHGD